MLTVRKGLTDRVFWANKSPKSSKIFSLWTRFYAGAEQVQKCKVPVQRCRCRGAAAAACRVQVQKFIGAAERLMF
jgi:hypothetical protein